jgi:hypothetical protein
MDMNNRLLIFVLEGGKIPTSRCSQAVHRSTETGGYWARKPEGSGLILIHPSFPDHELTGGGGPARGVHGSGVYKYRSGKAMAFTLVPVPVNEWNMWSKRPTFNPLDRWGAIDDTI